MLYICTLKGICTQYIVCSNISSQSISARSISMLCVCTPKSMFSIYSMLKVFLLNSISSENIYAWYISMFCKCTFKISVFDIYAQYISAKKYFSQIISAQRSMLKGIFSKVFLLLDTSLRILLSKISHRNCVFTNITRTYITLKFQ